jgi:hypothetical protein
MKSPRRSSSREIPRHRSRPVQARQNPPLRWSFPVMWLRGRSYCLGGTEPAHATSAVGRINAAAPSQRNRLRRSSEWLWGIFIVVPYAALSEPGRGGSN